MLNKEENDLLMHVNSILDEMVLEFKSKVIKDYNEIVNWGCTFEFDDDNLVWLSGRIAPALLLNTTNVFYFAHYRIHVPTKRVFIDFRKKAIDFNLFTKKANIN